ncbi:hypothetical protein [Pedobacter alpinus]|uniref:Uncharacterized protein n=2 Tax=Pedobacter alpinus TaxID=1590643 RepID=A0ABW5TMX9_9SPHI
MLRKSIPIFKIGVIVIAAGVALYFYNDNYGKYLLGLGMMILSVAIVFYILFMFKRYGEKKRS